MIYQDSLLRVKNTANQYVVPIGKGLFSRLAYEKNETIANFNGEVITIEEYDRRVIAGLGRNAIHLSVYIYIYIYIYIYSTYTI